MSLGDIQTVRAGVLDIAYHSLGPDDGWPCVMSHGFPYSPDAFAVCAPVVAARGARVFVPFLRGYGPTRFRHRHTMRSGEQAALGADLLAFLDALGIGKAVLSGYDWGGRASCVVSALHPERVTALVSANSYNIFDHARASEPGAPEVEAGNWYQYYLHTERGARGLDVNRRELTRYLWRTWSPNWPFDDATLDRTVSAFNNPDFVAVVLHSYRHRHNLVAGDPAYADIERALATQPDITVPAITIDGDADRPGTRTGHHAKRFTGPHEHRTWSGAGHNLPQECPDLWADAVCDAFAMAG
jgi:pimeloyl-ACP methyl ester carboxylesterase